MNQRSYKIFLSPLFIFGLLLLLLNDFFLKQQFHNFLTGKLSDFAGLFVFPIFFAAFFPKRKLAIYISTAIFFIFWKSPFSQGLIDFWNSIIYFKIWRVVDFSDLLALSVLPLSYFHFGTDTKKPKTFSLSFAKRAFASFIVLLSVFAFTATSYSDERTIDLESEYKFKLNHSDIENILKQNNKLMNLKIERQTDVFPPNKYPDPKSDPNVFFADFLLTQKVCDTQRIYFSFVIHEGKDFTTIKVASARLRCGDFARGNGNSNVELVKAIKKYQPELQTIFEREVIEKLRQNSSQ